MLKKAKKLGLNSQYIITDFNDIPIKVNDLKNGSFIILYDVNNLSYCIYEGEETEEQQIEKIKMKKIKSKSKHL